MLQATRLPASVICPRLTFGNGIALVALLLCLMAWTPFARAAEPTREARATVVVFNGNDPVSRDLAAYYAEKRGISSDRVIGLNAPSTEEISRQEFDQTIAGPLRDRFEKQGWWTVIKGTDGKSEVAASKIRYVALIRGIPLKIKADSTHPADKTPLPANIASRNEASVDSEITVLANYGRLISGFIPNPYFKRFVAMIDWNQTVGLLLVCRLDAPSGSDVRRMIDDSLAAEKSGLWGWAYVDSRGLTSGGYAEGDNWLRAASANMLKKGIPVIYENLPEPLPKAFPVTDAAIYFGWYAAHINGPFAAEDFRFRPGAITAHIHSFSAATLRSPISGWTGPLILHGAAASLGNVYEPYLSLTTRLDEFQDRLMAGFNLAESAYMATPALSWMGIVVGDPLYRPFAAWEQIENGKPNPWQKYQRAVLASEGDVVAAGKALRKLARTTGNSMFLEALGNAQALAKDYSSALAAFTAAGKLAANDRIRFRLTLEKMLALYSSGNKEAVEAMSMDAVSQFSDPAQTSLLMSWTRPPPPPPQPVGSPQPGAKAHRPAQRPSGASLKPKPPQPPGAGKTFP